MSSTLLLGTRALVNAVLFFDPNPLGTIASVEIVVPVHNEETDLAASIHALHDFLATFPLSWQVTIADNASTDATWAIACGLARDLPGVRAAHLDEKGRGRALRSVWARSDSPVVAYMDVDLSTGLDALLPLLAPLVSGHSDIAIGSRLAGESRVARGPKREAISRTYNMILKLALHAGFSDAQCGFKAARTEALRQLLPLVEDQGWFFDTELLVLAEHNGLRIHEVPVDWIDDPDSRVHIVSTAREDLRGIWRMMRTFARGGGEIASRRTSHGPDRTTAEMFVRFGSIGLVTTLAFAALFAALVGPFGPVAADVIALSLCTIANTAANRRLTFALRGRRNVVRHHGAALVAGLLPLILNVATLALLGVAGLTSIPDMLIGLGVANALASLAKFTVLDRFVFRSR